MLWFRDVQRLDFYVVGQVRFLGRIERDGFGDRLRLLPFLLFNKRAYKRNVFSAEDGKALPVLKSYIAQRYFIRAEIYAVNAKLKKRLRAFAEEYPELCRQTDDDGQGGLWFEIAKERISIRLTAPYSQERREAASKLAKENNTFRDLH